MRLIPALLRASLTHLGYLEYHNPRPEKDAAVTSFGRLDIMGNSAGIEMRTSVLDTTENHYDKALAIDSGWDLHPLESAAFARRTPKTTLSSIAADETPGSPC